MQGIEGIEGIVEAQGWNEETLLILATGFIAGKGLWDAFREYLETCAREENAEVTAAVDND
jgi:hypothetical protein